MTTHHAKPIPLASTLCSLAFAALALLASPPAAACDLEVSHPPLPDLIGPDIEGLRLLVVYLADERAIVEIDDQCFDLDGRPLEISLTWSWLTLLFMVPEDTGLFVTSESEDGEVLEASPQSRTIAFDLTANAPETMFELLYTGPLPAPTRPPVVVKPTEDDPDPK